MIELKTKEGAKKEVPMVDLFSIDGTVYQMAARPKANVALRYLVDLRGEGALMAEMRLMEALIGVDGYAALANHEDLEPSELQAIQTQAAALALGVLEDTAGNDEGGTPSSSG